MGIGDSLRAAEDREGWKGIVATSSVVPQWPPRLRDWDEMRCLLAADKWQIPFSSSLKCTSLILQMKQIKSLNSFLAQNVLNLTNFHSFEQAREKINTFFSHFKYQNTCYNTYFGPKLWNSLTFPWLPWYLKFPWPICKIPWLFPDLEEKSNFPDFSLTSGHPAEKNINLKKKKFNQVTESSSPIKF